MVDMRQMTRSSTASLICLLGLIITRANGLTQQYCSAFNSANTSPILDNYQSNGRCQTTCSGYAFAIIQDKSCWCSNFVPGTTTSVDSCSVACPGFPYENCGNSADGLYGYVALGPSPSGTLGAASPTSSPLEAAPATSSPQPAPTTSTTTSQYIPVTTTSTSKSSSTTSSSTSSTSTWTPTPVLSVTTVTGQVLTMTVTPTAPPASTQTIVKANAVNNNGSFFSSPGKVAGTFVAVAIVIVAILAGIILLCYRRLRQHRHGEVISSTTGSISPQRRPSRLSQMGLMGSVGSNKDTKPIIPTITTNDWGMTNGSEKSPADTLERRGSYPRMVDQRLEPTAVWNPLHNDGSNVSVRSFRDDQDYSRRMLRIANPDT